MARILVVDDEISVARILEKVLTSQNHEVVIASRGDEAVGLIKSSSFDLLLSDIRMSPMDGMELLKIVRVERPHLPVIMITAYATVETAVEALKLEVFDYIEKPLKVKELMETVNRALAYSAALAGRYGEGADLRAINYGVPNVVAESPQMKDVCSLIKRLSVADMTVLITGEFGVGKTLIARAIHDASVRHKNNFVVIPCAELPEPILDASVTGHVDDPRFMTPAGKDDPMETIGGTVYLQDVECLPLNTQKKMVKALEDRAKVVGKSENLTAGIRFLAGTTADLDGLVQEGLFNPDLCQRLTSSRIEIPPLRDRKADVIPVALHVIRTRTREGKVPLKLQASAQEVLSAYDWQGNVSELVLALDHAIETAKDDGIGKEHLPACIATVEVSEHLEQEGMRGKALKEFLRQRIAASRKR
jgi:DNA-binding NtrC family response regulator